MTSISAKLLPGPPAGSVAPIGRRPWSLTTGPRTVVRWLAHVPRPHLWAVAGLTLLAAGLRFYNLAFPALWNDETLVFWRVCGTYRQLLEPLRIDGFPPLHYELYWWLGHPWPIPREANRVLLRGGMGIVWTVVLFSVAAYLTRRMAVRLRVPVLALSAVATAATILLLTRINGGSLLWPDALVPAAQTLKLTPWVIRFIPALCGTLTVPAMYFLARQMLPPAASVAAAAITCCSAFMLFYSRDAKMYPDAWLMVTLNVACLLWWWKGRSSTAWLAWVAAGVAAVGLHRSSEAVPAISALFILTSRSFTWRRAVLFLVGLGVIYSGTWVYFTKFNVWHERVEALGWDAASGIEWVDGFFNGERTGPDLLQYAATAFLAGYEWPRVGYLHQIVESLQQVPQTISLTLIGLLAVTLLPWPLLRATVSPARQAARDAAGPEPAWRVWLWLGAWIAVPTYAIYCHSIEGFVGPLRWTWWLGQTVPRGAWNDLIVAVCLLIAGSVLYPRWRPMVWRLARFALVTAALFGACCGVYAGMWPAAMAAADAGRPWKSIWEPRYLGFMWPAVGVGVAALLWRLPTRPVRVAAVTFFCGANLFMAAMRMHLWTEPPIDRLAADTWAAQDRPGQPPSTTHTFDNINVGEIFVAGTNLGTTRRKVAGGRYYLQMLADRQPMSPDRFLDSLDRDVTDPFTLRQNYSARFIRLDLRRAPQVDRVMIWSQLFPDRQRLTFDPMRSALPGTWRLVSEDVYPVRVVWDWREYWKWVRREYRRVDAPK